MISSHATFTRGLLTLMISMLLLPGCARQEEAPQNPAHHPQEYASTSNHSLPLMPLIHDPAVKQQKPTGLKKRESSIYDANNPAELDFDVENQTGKTVFVTCFSYQRRRPFDRWHWVKSPVYELAPYQTITVDVDTIPDPSDRNFVFGYLAVMDTKQAADDCVIELLSDQKKLDLDQLINLKGKKVTLTVEKYGFTGDHIEYDFVRKDHGTSEATVELDFNVENKTGRTVFVTCFVYQKKAKGSWVGATEEKDDMTPWQFAKTPVLRLEPNQIGTIDVGSVATSRDRSYMRGYLGVFDLGEEAQAYNTTYELLPANNKVNLGQLTNLLNKKVVLEVENYGILEDYFNYVTKPVTRINFETVHGQKSHDHHAK